MQNKYLDTIKKSVIDYTEKKISSSHFIEVFSGLNEKEIYKSLEKDGYLGLSNFVSAIQELDDQSTLDSQWIVKIIDNFYAYFTNNLSYIYGDTFYMYLKFGLKKENNNPIELSFKEASKDYLNKKISGDCLGFIAKEFLNNLKYFQKEISSNPKLSGILNTTSKLNFNKILEDLTPKEKKLKLEINEKLKKYLVF